MFETATCEFFFYCWEELVDEYFPFVLEENSKSEFKVYKTILKNNPELKSHALMEKLMILEKPKQNQEMTKTRNRSELKKMTNPGSNSCATNACTALFH